MGNSPISWYELSLVTSGIVAAGAIVATIVAFLWSKLNENRSSAQKDVEKLRLEHKADLERMRDELTKQRVEVAKEYATNDALVKVEERLSATMRDAIGQLQKSFADVLDVLQSPSSRRKRRV